LFKKVEDNLPLFLLICGAAAVTAAGIWHRGLVLHALREPLHICLVVLILGFIFKKFSARLAGAAAGCVNKFGIKATLAGIVIIISLASSIITAILAALLLSEVSTMLCITRRQRVKFIVYACFAISAGAVLTPIGEPLATIVISKLSGAPYYAGEFFLLKLLWPYVFSIIAIMAALAYKITDEQTDSPACPRAVALTDNADVIKRAAKVYIFVAALVLLGAALGPGAQEIILRLSARQIYWVNLSAAALDNATVAAIAAGPHLPPKTLVYLLVSLIISGGLLVPGNIPNIISAAKLKISAKEWAREGVFLGLALFAFYFAVLSVYYEVFARAQ
jgi:predicted cation transporter